MTFPLSGPRLLARTVAAGLAAAALAVTLASCATTTRVELDTQQPARAGLQAELAGQGPVAYTVEKGSRTGEYGCSVTYELYRPAEQRTASLVVLGHGFASSLQALRGWAARWASFGVPTVVLSFCNSTPFDGRHDRNAEDMRALAADLHAGPVMYAGFSAGGLAAYLAACADSRAIAYLGLDAVDSRGLALARKDELRVPSLFLVGEPSSCNAKNNMLPAVPVREGVRVLRVRHATHGHFQDPYDPRVESLCGRVVPPAASEGILQDARALATAWILQATGAMPGAGELIEEAASGAAGWAERVEAP
jgi:dienelactone hydrolase